jgi:2'-5' RNA ligase superfamily
MTAPIIVTALIGEPDFAWLDSLRRAYFPPERNHLRVHLTMFHHLPPSIESELCNVLCGAARGYDPVAWLAGLIHLGSGVAYRVESPDLEDIRALIADHFTGLLTPQDQSPWRPHITIQNKVKAGEANALLDQLAADFRPKPLKLSGLSAWHYRGGPWEPIAAYAFGTGHKLKVVSDAANVPPTPQ